MKKRDHCAASILAFFTLFPLLAGFHHLKADPGAPPVITSDEWSGGIVGEPFAFQLEAAGPVLHFSAAPLPPGLSLDPATGVISGTPLKEGISVAFVGATNEHAPSLPVELNIGIYPATGNAPDIRPPDYQIVHAGEEFSFGVPVFHDLLGSKISVYGLPPGASHAWSPDGGLQLTGNVTAPGFHVITIKATNVYGETSSTFPLLVMDRIWEVIETADGNHFSAAAYGNGSFVLAGSRPNAALILQSTDDGKTWLDRSPSQVRRFYSLAHGNSVFVAQGMDGILYTSETGAFWTQRHESLSGAQLSTLWFGNAYFARAYSLFPELRFEVSADGINWQPHPRPLDGAMGMTFGNGRFLALGSEGHSSWATDPRGPWNPASWPGSWDHSQHLAAGGGVFVVAGRNGRIWTSDTGISWSRRSAGVSEDFQRVFYGDGRFVAVTDQGTILTSEDGDLWILQSAGAQTIVQSGAASEHTVILGGANGRILRSTGQWAPGIVLPGVHGITQGEAFSFSIAVHGDSDVDEFFSFGLPEGITLDPHSGEVSGVAAKAGNHEVLFAARAGGRMTDPVRFRLAVATAEETRPPIIEERMIAYEAGDFFTHGIGAESFLPVTGWQATGLPGGIEIDTYLDNNGSLRFRLAGALTTAGVYSFTLQATNHAGSDERIIHLVIPHRETEDWHRTDFPDTILGSLAYGNDRFVMVTNQDEFQVSTDGLLWTAAPHTLGAMAASLQFLNGEFLARMSNGRVVVSPEGEAWQDWTFPENSGVRHFTWGSLGYLAAGVNGWMAASPNGNDWMELPTVTSREIRGASYGNGHYFIQDGQRAWSSRDLERWELIAPNREQRPWNVVYGNGMYVGWDRFRLIVSKDAINWSPLPFPELLQAFDSIARIKYVDGLFVLHSSQSHTSFSIDAQHWSPLRPRFRVRPERMAIGNGQMAGVFTVLVSAVFSLPPTVAPVACVPHLTQGRAGHPLEADLKTAFGQADFIAAGLPPGLELDEATGRISGVPAATGVYEADIVALREGRPADPVVMRFEILPMDGEAEGLPGPDLVYEAGQLEDLFIELPLPHDPFGGYIFEGLPDGVFFDPFQAVLSGKPETFGTHAITVHIQSIYGDLTETFNLTVHPPDFLVTDAVTDFNLDAIAASPVRIAAAGISGRILTIDDEGIAFVEPDSAINQYYDIAFGDPGFVAVAGRRFATGDGTDESAWTSGTFDGSFSATTVAFGNGQYVAAGGTGQFAVSADGIAWSNVQTTAGGATTQVRYAGGLFIAVGRNGSVLTSADGLSWTQQVLPVAVELFSVAYGNGLYVAGGEGGTVLTSENASDWAQLENLPFSMFDIAHAKGQFVGASGMRLYTSGDGLHWIERKTGASVRAVSWDPRNEQFVAAGQGRRIVTATGEWPPFLVQSFPRGQVGEPLSHTFEAHYAPLHFAIAGKLPPGLSFDTGSGTLSGIPEEAGDFTIHVAAINALGSSEPAATRVFIYPESGPEPEVPESGAMHIVETGKPIDIPIKVGNQDPDTRFFTDFLPDWLTLDGETGRLGGTLAQPGRHDLTVYVENFFGIAETEVSLYAYSPLWNRHSLGTTHARNSITFGNDRFVAVGNSGYVSVSPDGRTWTSNRISSQEQLQEVVFAFGRFFAVGGSRIFTSETGDNWTVAYQGMSWIRHIAWTGEKLVTVARSRFITSQDGEQWDEVTLPFSHDAAEIAYGNGRLVSLDPPFRLAIFDGTNWTHHPWPAELRHPDSSSFAARTIAFGGGVFVAAGDRGIIARSTDGLNWERRNWPDSLAAPTEYPGSHIPVFNDVYWTGDEFIIVGTQSMILRSSDGYEWREMWRPRTGVSTDWSRQFQAVTSNDEKIIALEFSTVEVASRDWPPIVTSPPVTYGLGGQYLEYQVETDRSAIVITAEGLPPGMQLDPVSGLISGKPAEAGSYLVTVLAGNEVNVSTPFFLTMVVYPESGWLPRVTSGNAAIAGIGRLFEYRIESEGTDLSTVYTAQNVPPGLDFDAATGTLSGVPVTAGNFTIPLTVSNVYGERSFELSLFVADSEWKPASSPTAVTLQAATYGGGTFVAVGAGGTILVSDDGISWTTRDSPTENDLNDVAFGGGGFLAVGTSGVGVSSVDGESWEAVSLANVTLNGITFGDEWCVIAGNQTSVRMAPDGSNRRTVTGLGAQSYVTWGPSGFVISGRGNPRHSINGLNWTAITEMGLTLSGWNVRDLAFDGQRYLAALYNETETRGRVLSSLDGLAWSQSDFKPAADLQGLSEGPGTIVVGSDGFVAVSVSGLFWLEDFSGTRENLRAAVRGGDTYVAVGEDGAIFYRPANWAPAFFPANEANGQVGVPFSYSLFPAGKSGQLTALRLPEGLNFDPETAVIHGTPEDHGHHVAVIEASNEQGTSLVSIPIMVAGTPPVITAVPAEIMVHEGEPFNVAIAAHTASETTVQWLRNDSEIIDGRFEAGALSISAPEALLTDSGRYSVILSNPFGTAKSPEIPVLVVLSYEAWADAFELSGDHRAADFRLNGGVPNLLAYVLGLAPGEGFHGAVPAMSKDIDGPAFVVRPARWATNARIFIEGSTDLTTWHPITITEGLEKRTTDSLFEEWTVRNTNNGPWRFFRVRLEPDF